MRSSYTDVLPIRYPPVDIHDKSACIRHAAVAFIVLREKCARATYLVGLLLSLVAKTQGYHLGSPWYTTCLTAVGLLRSDTLVEYLTIVPRKTDHDIT